MVSIDPTAVGAAPANAETGVNKFYFAAWRWHFYAGLFVVPFFLVLAVTGMMMLWIAHLDGRDGERIPVTPQGQTTSLNLQAAVAIASVPDGQPVQYVAPRAPSRLTDIWFI